MGRDLDWKLLSIAIILSIIGLISIYSATHYRGNAMFNYSGDLFNMSSSLWFKQLIWLLISLVVAVFMANFNYQRFWDLAWFLYITSLVLLILVLLVGEAKSGAKRWLDFGQFSVQPAELAKISIILFLARYFSKLMSYQFSDSVYRSRAYVISKTVLIPILIVFIPMLLIIKQPDLGSSIVLLPILLIILFCAHIPMKLFSGLIVLGAAAMPFLWHFLKPYQQRRLLVFLNPNMDPLGAGYTITQSKIAIGSGQILGKGWLAGSQNQLNFLPERHTDFIFSIIAEEWGFLGSLAIMCLYFLLIWRIIEVSSKTNDIFGRLICVGLVAFLSFQVLVNIAMTTGIMPVVGLPLPFISYGGSSLLLSFFCIGIVLNISKQHISF